MKVWVKLFGTLRLSVFDYDPEHGLEIEIPDGAKIKDLLARLEILQSNAPIIFINNQIAKMDDELIDGSWINLVQSAFGG